VFDDWAPFPLKSFLLHDWSFDTTLIENCGAVVAFQRSRSYTRLYSNDLRSPAWRCRFSTSSATQVLHLDVSFISWIRSNKFVYPWPFLDGFLVSLKLFTCGLAPHTTRGFSKVTVAWGLFTGEVQRIYPCVWSCEVLRRFHHLSRGMGHRATEALCGFLQSWNSWKILKVLNWLSVLSTGFRINCSWVLLVSTIQLLRDLYSGIERCLQSYTCVGITFQIVQLFRDWNNAT
jgi:hypothetical protein